MDAYAVAVTELGDKIDELIDEHVMAFAFGAIDGADAVLDHHDGALVVHFYNVDLEYETERGTDHASKFFSLADLVREFSANRKGDGDEQNAEWLSARMEIAALLEAFDSARPTF